MAGNMIVECMNVPAQAAKKAGLVYMGVGR